MWSEILFLALVAVATAIFWSARRHRVHASVSENVQLTKPSSVNFHFTRTCNYHCGFCFHTDTNNHIEQWDRIQQGLLKLVEAGMEKLNFAGGEPFLFHKLLGKMCAFAKRDLSLKVSIVSNGSMMRKPWMNKWMEEHAQYLDMLAISVDSFNEDSNTKIGRCMTGKQSEQLENVSAAAAFCKKYGIKFKINTVVNAYNWEEDMNNDIQRLDPYRWKVFQCLIIEGENNGDGTKRDGRNFVVNDMQFKAFLKRHQGQQSLVPEDNDKMRTSYLILDEFMRFLDCSSNGKLPGPCILDVSIAEALKLSGFNETIFEERGGSFYTEWTAETGNRSASCGSSTASSSQPSVLDIEDLPSPNILSLHPPSKTHSTRS